MFHLKSYLAAITLVAVGAGRGSSEDQSWESASTNVPPSAYPQVDKERRVRFRIVAPNAERVQLMPGGKDNGLGQGPMEMSKQDDGSWTITTQPAVPGFHYYWFLVDNLEVNDRGSRAFFGWNKECSGVEVPDPNGDFYSIQNIAHGDVRRHWYHSPVTNMWRQAIVYTPPGYDKGDDKYPVLYLQHGSGESETGWTNQGHANLILDNLIASKRCVPMIVVMENGMVAPKYPPTRDDSRGRHNAAFGQLLVEDLVPEIDGSYRTIPDRLHRAVAGLSMGAGQAAKIGLSSGVFSYIGCFSGVQPVNDFSNASGIKLLWAACGTKESSPFQRVEQMIDTAKAAGIHATWNQIEGTAHEWQTWRYCLRDFAPNLFRDSMQGVNSP